MSLEVLTVIEADYRWPDDEKVVKHADYAALEAEFDKIERVAIETEARALRWYHQINAHIDLYRELKAKHDAAQAECERLREALQQALSLFPFDADAQTFHFNGQKISADGDERFYSAKRVNSFLHAVHAAMSAKP